MCKTSYTDWAAGHPSREIPHLTWLFAHTALGRPAGDTVGTGALSADNGADKIGTFVVHTSTGIRGVPVRQHPRSDAQREEFAPFTIVNCVRVQQETKPIRERLCIPR